MTRTHTPPLPPATLPTAPSSPEELLRALPRLGETTVILRCRRFNLWHRTVFGCFACKPGSRKWRDASTGLGIDPGRVASFTRHATGSGETRYELTMADTAASLTLLCKKDDPVPSRRLRQALGRKTRHPGNDDPRGSDRSLPWLDEQLETAPTATPTDSHERSAFEMDPRSGMAAIRFASPSLDLEVRAFLKVVDRDRAILRLANPGTSTVLYLPAPADRGSHASASPRFASAC